MHYHGRPGIVLLLLTIVLLSSGCTQAPERGNVSDAPPVYNESVLEGGLEAAPGDGWYCGSLKVNASLAGARPEIVINAAKEAEFSFIAMAMNISRGDADAQLEACEQANEEGLLCIPAHVTGDCEGSLVILGISEPIKGANLDDIVDIANQRGGVSFVTHPTQEVECGEWRRWDLPGFNGIAIVSPMTQRMQDDEEALEKWHALLNSGRRVFAYGETDLRSFSTTYAARNMLDSSYQCLYIEGNLTQDSVKDALRAGRFYVTNGPVVKFSVNGHGPGEEFNASYGEEVEINLNVSSALAFNRVRIIKNGIVLQEIGKSLNKYSTNITSLVAEDTWFSVDVWGSDYTPEYHDFLHAIMNPIWVRVEVA